MSLDQLRCRMPELRKQDQAVQAELQSLETAAAIKTNTCGWSRRLPISTHGCGRRDTLDVPEQQKILRLLVKEVLVGRETITIRHSIRIPTSGPAPSASPQPPQEPQQAPTSQPGPCCLLRSGRRFAAAQ